MFVEGREKMGGRREKPEGQTASRVVSYDFMLRGT